MSLVQHVKDEKILSPVICRICATEQDECMNDLLTSIHNGLYFIDMLQYCLQRSIDKDNRFPLSICLECTSNLITAYNFNVLCNDSEQKFIKEMLDYHVKCDSLERKVQVIVDESENDVKPSHFVDCAVIEIPKRNCDASDAKNSYDSETDTEKTNVSIELNSQRKLRKTRASCYECYRCKASFRRIDYLRQHLTYHYSDKELWKCSDCQKRFTQRKSLLKHLYKHTNATCEYCTETFTTFTTLRDLKRHCLRKHNDQLIKYNCHLCARKFLLKAQLVIHMHNHDTSQQYNCNDCNEKFATESQLKGHIRAIHTSFLCSECGKTFKNNSLLTSHQKVHNADRPFVCSKCPSRFKWKVALTYHMTIHQTERKHVCETCGMSFTTRSAMKGHMRIHTGERPFACNKCPKRFYRSTHLTRHYLSHTGEKPYSCKYCDKGFRQCAQLNKHLRTHVGENTYQCNLCPKNYRLKIDLRKHFHSHYCTNTAAAATSES